MDGGEFVEVADGVVASLPKSAEELLESGGVELWEKHPCVKIPWVPIILVSWVVGELEVCCGKPLFSNDGVGKIESGRVKTDGDGGSTRETSDGVGGTRGILAGFLYPRPQYAFGAPRRNALDVYLLE